MKTTTSRLLAASGVAAAAMTLSASQSLAQLVTYDFTNYPRSDDGAAPATTADGVTASNFDPNEAGFQAQAPGSNSSNYAFSSGSGQSGGSLGFQANTTADSQAAAISVGTYFSITLTPDAGSQLSFGDGDELTFFLQPRTFGGSAGFVSNVALGSSATGFANILDTASAPGANSSDPFVPLSLDLSSIGTLAAGTPVELRLFVYDDPDGNGGADSKIDTIVVNGTVSAAPIPEPASLGLLGLGGVALLARRRKSV